MRDSSSSRKIATSASSSLLAIAELFGNCFAIITGAQIVVVSWCANPDCRRELRYFREGKIYPILMSPANGHTRLEHFWLCGECFKIMSLVFINQRDVKLMRRTTTLSVEPANEPDRSPVPRVP